MPKIICSKKFTSSNIDMINFSIPPSIPHISSKVPRAMFKVVQSAGGSSAFENFRETLHDHRSVSFEVMRTM